MPVDANAAGNGSGGTSHGRGGGSRGGSGEGTNGEAESALGPVPSGSGEVGSGNPARLHSSKSRYHAYLARRREDGKGRAGRKPAAAGPAGPRKLGDEDPNSPRRLKRNRSFWVLLGEFWRMIRGHRLTVLLCIGTVTIAALVTLAAPASTKVAIDYILAPAAQRKEFPAWVPARIVGATPSQRLWYLGAVLMCLTLVAVSTGIWGRYQMTRMTQLMRAAVRRRVFNHTVRLPLHRVYELKSGGAASILREDAGQAADLLFSLMYNPWRAVVQLVGALVIIGLTDWHLLLGAVALVPAAYFTQKAWIGRIRPLFREVRNTRTMIDAHATEAFGGMRIVRGFVRQRAEAARFIRNNYLMAREEVLAWWWSRAIEIVWQILLPLGSVTVLIYCGNRVLGGTMTLGDLMMFSAYLILLLSPLEALSASATSIQAELASLDRIMDLLAEPEEFQAGAGSGQTRGQGDPEARRGGAGPGLASLSPGLRVPVSSRPAHISINRLSFKYPKAQDWVLRDIDLDVPAGSTVALVGPSGAGKTTLCNLVARFYDPTEGAIELDGTDIRALPVDDYRKLLGIVEQDVFLFDGTVLENIGYARRGVTLADVRAAARAANADGFIEKLEHGYDTLIGERGVRLSGGQKQRIAIARAILADPRILILDEATSNLDTESEQLIQQSLRTLMRGRTCFVIAHRLSTIRHADLIVVIDHGQVIERGTHAELIAREGRYWRMLQQQMTRAEDQAEAAKEGVQERAPRAS